MAEEYDPRYLRGIDSFNRCAFFDAHEEWESLWQEWIGDDRTFYQGLIQVAVCLHHVGRHNLRGAGKLYRSSCNYLRPYRPWHAGINLEQLLNEFRDCWLEIEQCADRGDPRAVTPRKLPRITLSESPRTRVEQTERTAGDGPEVGSGDSPIG